MQTALPVGVKTVFAEATVGEDGSLRLKDSTRLSLKPGDKVALTISPIMEASRDSSEPLRGTVVRYDDPFGLATEPEEWEALR